MSITDADIEKLASLSRMKLSAEERSQFAKEIDSILGYVEQIKEVSAGGASGKKPSDIPHRNILRADIADRDLGDDTSILIEAAPKSLDGYVQVKKILN